MATVNPFDLLVDDDNDDPSQMIAAQKVAKKSSPVAAAPAKEVAKMPAKPLPPAQAVREAKSNTSTPRGGGFSRGGPGRGRGDRSGNTREFNNNGFGQNYSGEGGGGDRDGGNRERFNGPRQTFRGGRNDSYGEAGAGAETEGPRRNFERRSGTGRGYEMKRDGSGQGNWGIATDDATQENESALIVDEKITSPEKQTEEDVLLTDASKENKEVQAKEAEQKEKEDKEMTLEEYEKIREEKRKALLALKTEERKVEIDNELKSMQQLSLKKESDEIFVKLGSGKEEKKKESIDKDEKTKKSVSVSISEFLKPAEGERNYSGRGRGRGRGRGGDNTKFNGGDRANFASAPSIEDRSHFPILGAK